MPIPTTWPTRAQDRARRFLALWKYYQFSRTLSESCVPFVGPIFDGQNVGRENKLRATALVTYWIASLEVLCEGWTELRLSDPIVDELLTESHRATLRKYRHTVFHFQADLDEARITALQGSLPAMKWVFDLGSAFQAFFDRHADAIDVESIRPWLFEDA